MKKKTYYRIELFPDANTACEKAALLAARENSEKQPMTLKSIAVYAITFATLAGENVTPAFLDDNTLIIDCKVGEDWKQGMIITQVEIMELGKVVEMESEDDIPDGVFTATNGHGGLAD